MKSVKQTLGESLAVEAPCSIGSTAETARKSYIKGIIYISLSYFVFSINGFQFKLVQFLFREKANIQLFMFTRSIVIFLVGLKLLSNKGKSFSEVKDYNNKAWLLARCVFNYVAFLLLILSYNFLRLSTAMCFSSAHPIFVVLFSIWFLKEKFHIRYVFGLIICLTGTFMILLNERHPEHKHYMLQGKHDQITRIVIGGCLGSAHMITAGFIFVAHKKLINDKLDDDLQITSIGLMNGIIALSIMVLSGQFVSTGNIWYYLFAASNGLVFYSAIKFMSMSYELLEISKTISFGYLMTILIFVYGAVFFNEPVFFTDVIGSLLIFGFNVYHTKFPIAN